MWWVAAACCGAACGACTAEARHSPAQQVQQAASECLTGTASGQVRCQLVLHPVGCWAMDDQDDKQALEFVVSVWWERAQCGKLSSMHAFVHLGWFITVLDNMCEAALGWRAVCGWFAAGLLTRVAVAVVAASLAGWF